MANIEGIDRRIEKLERGKKLQPFIVWGGQDDTVELEPGQELMVITWQDDMEDADGSS